MESITSLLAIALAAILVNNFVLSQFLGICPFMGVSKKVETARGHGHGGYLRYGSWPPPCATGPSTSC